MTAEEPGAKKLIRVIVASHDRSRVLARPAGLAGWLLPAVAVGHLPTSAEDWAEVELARAERVVGGPVVPVERVDVDVWEFAVTGRVIAAGRTWIRSIDADRLGSDALAVRRWARRAGGSSADEAASR